MSGDCGRAMRRAAIRLLPVSAERAVDPACVIVVAEPGSAGRAAAEEIARGLRGIGGAVLVDGLALDAIARILGPADEPGRRAAVAALERERRDEAFDRGLHVVAVFAAGERERLAGWVGSAVAVGRVPVVVASGTSVDVAGLEAAGALARSVTWADFADAIDAGGGPAAVAVSSTEAGPAPVPASTLVPEPASAAEPAPEPAPATEADPEFIEIRTGGRVVRMRKPAVRARQAMPPASAGSGPAPRPAPAPPPRSVPAHPPPPRRVDDVEVARRQAQIDRIRHRMTEEMD